MTYKEENEVLGEVFRRLLKDNEKCWYAGLVPSGVALIMNSNFSFDNPDLRTSLKESEAKLMKKIAPQSYIR